MTLAEMVGPMTPLYDNATGIELRDAHGIPDFPFQYEVLGGSIMQGWFVQGPSGQIDRTNPNDHTRLDRDVELS